MNMNMIMNMNIYVQQHFELNKNVLLSPKDQIKVLLVI
jgi:hypothetical protein